MQMALGDKVFRVKVMGLAFWLIGFWNREIPELHLRFGVSNKIAN